MVAFELIKCFAPAAAANLFFHSLFSLRMGRVIEREIAALAAPKGTVQWMKWIAVLAEINGNGVGWGWAVLGWVIGGCKPQATSPKKRRAQPTECLFSFSFPFVNEFGEIKWMKQIEKRNKEMKLKKRERAKCWNGMEWIYLRSLMAKQINERQWNGINQRRTKGANRPRQANNSTILLLCWLALWGQAKNGWIGRVGGGRWFSLSLLLVMGQRPLYRGRTHSKRNETSLSVWPPCFPSLQSSN